MKKLVAILCVLIAGCGGAPKTQEEIKVISSFYPLEFIVSTLEPELNQYNLLGEKNIHGFDLSTSDLVKMDKATVVFGLNLNLEPWLRSFRDKNLELVDKNLKMLEVESDFHAHLDEDEHVDENGHVDEHVDEGLNAEAYTDTDAEISLSQRHDPHVWMSPSNMIQMTHNIYNSLEMQELLSSGAEARLAELVKQLEELDREFANGLTNCKQQTAFVSHNSFAYLEDAYQFDLTSILGISSLDRLSIKDLRELETVNTTSILVEALENQEYSNLLKNDLNLESFVVYNLSKQVDGLDYFQMQYKNLESLKSALQCL